VSACLFFHDRAGEFIGRRPVSAFGDEGGKAVIAFVVGGSGRSIHVLAAVVVLGRNLRVILYTVSCLLCRTRRFPVSDPPGLCFHASTMRLLSAALVRTGTSTA